MGNSQYGEYYLYIVRNGGGDTEYSFFAPQEVHEQLKNLKRGSRAVVTKFAEQKGNKIITRYEVSAEQAPKKLSSDDTVLAGGDGYFSAMLNSYLDAMKIQEKLNGMVDVNRIAITLFIARSKVSGNGFNGG